MPTALITGITGQDGSYLSELLLEKGYTVHGLVRRSSNTARVRLDSLFADKSTYEERLFLHYAELDDATTIRRILIRCQADEVYHLAGQSHVGASFDIPETTCQFTAMGTLKLLEILRDLEKRPRLVHISSSEVFGRPDHSLQNERTPMRPVTPYGIAKAFATQMVSLYRESFDLFACNAICYNHESPRRGESFVTRKITRAAAAIASGSTEKLKLGSLDSTRDWGYAPEYVEGMWRMLQQPTADDYILATGTSHSIEEFLNAAFECVDLNWRDHVVQDARYMRPSEVSQLVGDAHKARSILGWTPQTQLNELAHLMVNADLLRISSL
ncbi:GDP-mannose 4,6-dehydratase [Rubripirellula amarantea]|uniref:GDP-mannose 4,6-dehydratase n=1 Tax=Rubripirellula amarantea TaxID=2527999 RepID=A0A5C5WPB1_9BACT|nr:GDP-mannose 4,6-dehydratase [Rubripirellula amarantea]TWT52636.1 GDP-mannose 4,6-dehydratase [Rubripirellula amarantea]